MKTPILPSIRQAVVEAYDSGLSVVPPLENGEKRPFCPWERFQRDRPHRDELEQWYGTDGPPRRTGMGVVCGAVSGNVECLEFDAHGEAYGPFKAAAEALGLGDLVERVEAGYLERSPSGGIHWLYRCSTIAGNTKLAEYDSDEIDRKTGKVRIKVLIETRGEGGYVVTAPSNGKVHPTGGAYELHRGGFSTIATITPKEREALWTLARSFDRLPEPEPEQSKPKAKGKSVEDWDDTLSPIDDFNEQQSWSSVLPHGWTLVFTQGDTQYWRRPGKDRGHSATINRNGKDRLYVFSTSTEFETGKPYSKFDAYTRLKHNDNFSKAAAQLIKDGYGSHKRWEQNKQGEWELRILQNPCPPGHRIAKPGEGPPGDLDASGKSKAGPSASPGEPEPWPALRLGELPTVPPFPLDVLPPPVARLAVEAAGAVGCDPGLVAGPILAIAGGLIGRSASLLLGSNRFAQAIVFQANIALPGDGKSPALDYAASVIYDIDRELAAAFRTEKQAYLDAMAEFEEARRKKDRGSVKPTPPVPKRVNIDDSTMEAVFRVMASNPRGLTVCKDELASLILGLNQYKGGAGNDRPNLLKSWTGSPIQIDRVLNEFGEPIRIPHPFLCITGNMPPVLLGEMINRRGDDGLIDRWLYVFPDRRPKLKSGERRPVSNDAIRGWAEVVRSLWGRPLDEADGDTHPHIIYFSNSGKAEFDLLYDLHVDEVNAEDFPDTLRGPWSKLEEYAGRLCLILTLLNEAADPTADRSKLPTAGVREVRDAWRLVDYFKGHHKRVRAYIQGKGLGGAPDGARWVMNWVRNNPDRESFTGRDLTLSYPPSHGYDRAMMEDGLLWLQQRNAIRPAPQPVRPPGTPGRKPSPTWLIHPEIRGAPRNPGIPQNGADESDDAPEFVESVDCVARQENAEEIQGEPDEGQEEVTWTG